MLHIQDPYFSDSYTLHEAMIRSCTESISGQGAYAFASKSGIEILLKDAEFDSLLERGGFSLIVGIDEITNIASLEALNEIKGIRPNLNVRAFDHNNRGSLFHPKLSYFKNEDESGSLIIGSGNLTLGGLRRNREAFSLVSLSPEEIIRIEQYWNGWLEQSSDYLKDINDPEVLRKANDNVFVRRARIAPTLEPTEEPTEIVTDDTILHEDGWQFYPESNVLIAEIPRSGDRWKQANFDINTFQHFFGATPGDNSQRVLLRNINDDLTLSSIEIRPSVSVVSQNYRFELDAASGLLYPINGKPIGVFIKLTTRMFLYHLYMPGQNQYEEINDWLGTNWSGRADRMKRIVTEVSSVSDIINESVFHGYLNPS
jgi:HKD family nuclease